MKRAISRIGIKPTKPVQTTASGPSTRSMDELRRVRIPHIPEFDPGLVDFSIPADFVPVLIARWEMRDSRNVAITFDLSHLRLPSAQTEFVVTYRWDDGWERIELDDDGHPNIHAPYRLSDTEMSLFRHYAREHGPVVTAQQRSAVDLHDPNQTDYTLIGVQGTDRGLNLEWRPYFHEVLSPDDTITIEYVVTVDSAGPPGHELANSYYLRTDSENREHHGRTVTAPIVVTQEEMQELCARVQIPATQLPSRTYQVRGASRIDPNNRLQPLLTSMTMNIDGHIMLSWYHAATEQTASSLYRVDGDLTLTRIRIVGPTTLEVTGGVTWNMPERMTTQELLPWIESSPVPLEELLRTLPPHIRSAGLRARQSVAHDMYRCTNVASTGLARDTPDQSETVTLTMTNGVNVFEVQYYRRRNDGMYRWLSTRETVGRGTGFYSPPTTMTRARLDQYIAEAMGGSQLPATVLPNHVIQSRAPRGIPDNMRIDAINTTGDSTSDVFITLRCNDPIQSTMVVRYTVNRVDCFCSRVTPTERSTWYYEGQTYSAPALIDFPSLRDACYRSDILLPDFLQNDPFSAAMPDPNGMPDPGDLQPTANELAARARAERTRLDDDHNRRLEPNSAGAAEQQDLTPVRIQQVSEMQYRVLFGVHVPDGVVQFERDYLLDDATLRLCESSNPQIVVERVNGRLYSVFRRLDVLGLRAHLVSRARAQGIRSLGLPEPFERHCLTLVRRAVPTPASYFGIESPEDV